MIAQSPMPDRIGPYRLLEKIGEGGMGVVYLARDHDGRAVAIKVLRPGVASDHDARRRLSREFETMRRVRSRFVAEVIDADVTGDRPYVVTRYVAGPSLDQLIGRDGPLRGRALERVAWGLAEGLAAVHAAGVVHRDLKPANVLLAGGVPVVIDFGIAHTPDATRITQTGMFMGTPGYLAPEVVEGQPFGPPADVHSWASTVAFGATGRAPFGTGSYETIFYRIVAGQPDLAGVPAKLLPLLTAALGRDPASRPTSMQLSATCAALDLSGPDEPASGGSGWPPGAAAAGGLIGAGAAGGVIGAGAASAAMASAAAPGTLMDGMPALAPRPARAGLRPGTRQLPAMAGSDNFADVLPPVRYAAAPAAPAASGADLATQAPARRQAPAQAPARPGVRRLLALLTMAIAVAASVLLPVAGTIAATAMIVLLRAADRAHGGLTRRRSEQGARLSDVPVMLATAPWALVRALISSLVLAPLALACAAAAAAATIIAVHVHPYQAAGGFAAGAFVAFYAFGLGSGKPRRQLGRLYGAVARRRLPAVVTAAVLAVLAIGVAGAAVTQPHDIWPLSPTWGWHIPGLRHLADRVAFSLHHL